MKRICWFALFASACHLSVGECVVLCGANRHCPLNLTCGDDGYCHGDGKSTDCVPLDAGTICDGAAQCTDCKDPCGPYNHMFTTANVYTPGQDYTGVAGADALCTRIANGAGLSGAYVAWLSTSQSNAIDRLGSTASGWVRADGRPFAASREDLLAGKILYPARTSESGTDLLGAPTLVVATATNAHGEWIVGSSTAADWSSGAVDCDVGQLDDSTGLWTHTGPQSPCGATHLYCFGTYYNRPLQITPAAGKKAFLSHGVFTPGGGLSAADSICQTEGGSPNFAALLSTTTAAAARRFTDSQMPWVRVDGIVWVASYADLAAGRALSSLNVDSFGSYESSVSAWTGARDPGSMSANAQSDCDGWTSSSGTGTSGSAASVSSFFYSSNAVSCSDTTTRLYCLER